MKRILLTSVLAVLVAFGTTLKAQDYPEEYLGLPGDNLNLYAVMKLFQESETIEAFERSLNDENSRINNLDLNNDNYVDYITVDDYVDGDVHNIVLRDALDKNEFQDVAVFTVQKFPDGSVQIQLIGDEALYGKNYIIEPNYAETPNPGYTGKSNGNLAVNVIYTSSYDIARWPIVRIIYLPGYRVWRSSWYWGYYPVYWHPWRPLFWHYYYGYQYNWYYYYYRHYRHWDHPRYPGYNAFYFSGHRSYSPKVYDRISKGSYKTTYSHPEKRRDGETLFTSMYPDRERRTDQNTLVMSRRRSTSEQVSRSQAPAKSSAGTTRRSESSGTTRNPANVSTRQSTGESRRSTTSVSSKPVTKSSSRQVTDVSRRPATYVNEKPSTVSRKSEPVRKESAPKVSKPSQSKTERRAASATKKSSSVKKTEKPKKSEDSSTRRR
jgi:hypothetical protein